MPYLWWTVVANMRDGGLARALALAAEADAEALIVGDATINDFSEASHS